MCLDPYFWSRMCCFISTGNKIDAPGVASAAELRYHLGLMKSTCKSRHHSHNKFSCAPPCADKLIIMVRYFIGICYMRHDLQKLVPRI
jgi:hypothetical protein